MGPRCCPSAEHRMRGDVTGRPGGTFHASSCQCNSAADSTHLPGISDFWRQGGQNIVVSQLLETMKKVTRHLMEPKGRNLGLKRKQVLDVFISRIFWKAFLMCAQRETPELRALSPLQGVPTARCSAPSFPAPSHLPGFH